MATIRRAVVMATLVCLVAILLAAPAAGRSEGPFTARIVDAETGTPVPGVIVVALYQKKTPGTVHPNTEFYDVDETVSDADGRFAFPARDLPMSTPLIHVIGRQMIIFKAGYKGWRFRAWTAGRIPGFEIAQSPKVGRSSEARGSSSRSRLRRQ